MKARFLLASTAVGITASMWALTPASAQADVNSARYIAANCANCHGTHGVARGGMPSLAGQKKDQIATRMREFRDGKRAATLMHQIAKGYSDAQIDAIAEQIARQSMSQ